jgi:hypothetical protein
VLLLFTAETQSAQRKISFSFPLRGRKTKNLALRQGFNLRTFSLDTTIYIPLIFTLFFDLVLKAVCFLLSALSAESKKKNKLCELCASAVKN